ncbi:MAG: PDZ domain-containing protein [Proteobacteria bacterium]|nr:PDZ domain-containing protein [Pseudomonadota bacterium]
MAAQDGRLRRGDEILYVNGKSLKDCTHKKAAGIIRVREKQEYNIIASAMKLSQFPESKQNH